MTGALGTVAAVVAIFTSLGVNPWHTVGWYSPSRHAADIAAVRAEFIEASTSSEQETAEFRTEWRCSEWAEDLDDLYEQQESGDDSDRLQDRIDALRERMDDAGCQKYEDY